MDYTREDVISILKFLEVKHVEYKLNAIRMCNVEGCDQLEIRRCGYLEANQHDLLQKYTEAQVKSILKAFGFKKPGKKLAKYQEFLDTEKEIAWYQFTYDNVTTDPETGAETYENCRMVRKPELSPAQTWKHPDKYCYHHLSCCEVVSCFEKAECVGFTFDGRATKVCKEHAAILRISMCMADVTDPMMMDIESSDECSCGSHTSCVDCSHDDGTTKISVEEGD